VGLGLGLGLKLGFGFGLKLGLGEVGGGRWEGSWGYSAEDWLLMSEDCQ